MADRTQELRDALEKRNVRISGRWHLENVEEFLKEAYRILAHVRSLHAYLLSQRQAYLSTTAPPRHLLDRDSRKHLTDTQRDQIDAESKQILRELNAAIRHLAETEDLRRSAEEVITQKKYGKSLGAIGRWAAGGLVEAKTPEQLLAESRSQSIKIHRENIIWYLRQKLEATGNLQRSMVETRLVREVEKSKSVLYKARGLPQGFPTSHEARLEAGSGQASKVAMMDEQEKRAIEQQLSPEQLQLFAKENQDMLKHYEDALEQVRTAEKSLVEISELQTTLAGNLATQAAQIDQMVADSLSTAENVGSGNRELKRATERRSTAKTVFFSSLAFSSFLILYDLLI